MRRGREIESKSVRETEGVWGFGSAANSNDIYMNSSCFNTIIALVLIIVITGMDGPRTWERHEGKQKDKMSRRKERNV